MARTDQPGLRPGPDVHPISTPMYVLAHDILHGQGDWHSAQALAALILATDQAAPRIVCAPAGAVEDLAATRDPGEAGKKLRLMLSDPETCASNQQTTQ